MRARRGIGRRIDASVSNHLAGKNSRGICAGRDIEIFAEERR
jgi:hypothetical protein